MASGAVSDAFLLRLRLADLRPPVWRRLLIPADLSLARLHRAIQAAFGWEDAHGHVFRIGEGEYGESGAEGAFALKGERVSLAFLGAGPGSRFTYEYGFGEPWTLEGTVEARVPAQPPLRKPRCVGGALPAPPETPAEPPPRGTFDLARTEAALRAAFQEKRRRISTS